MEDDQQFGESSPPYPGSATTSKSLYRHLQVLREWVIDQHAVIRPMVPPKYAAQLVAPDNMAADTVWEGVGVIDKYTHLMFIRRIREGWDYVLREHEDAWDSKLALRKRFSLVVMAQQVLKDAFVSPEVREMREQQAHDQYAATMKALDKHLKKVLIPKELQDSDDEPAEDSNDMAGDDWWDEIPPESE